MCNIQTVATNPIRHLDRPSKSTRYWAFFLWAVDTANMANSIDDCDGYCCRCNSTCERNHDAAAGHRMRHPQVSLRRFVWH